MYSNQTGLKDHDLYLYLEKNLSKHPNLICNVSDYAK